MTALRSRIRLLPAMLLASFSLMVLPLSPAVAFIDQFRIDPASPVENISFDYRFRTGFCHGVYANSPQPLSLARTAEVLELTVAIGNNTFCNLPIVDRHRYAIPGLPEGSYRIDLYMVDVVNSPNVRVLLSQLPFRVVAGTPPPQAVPTNASWAVLLLGLLVGALALRRLAH